MKETFLNHMFEVELLCISLSFEEKGDKVGE
jgi:hypothetical protein